MERYIFALLITGVFLAVAADSFSSRGDMDKRSNSETATSEPFENQASKSIQTRSRPSTGNPYNRVAKIRMDRTGHFITKAHMNNVPVEVMVDTGASAVAINESTARKLGIRLTRKDFVHPINTANGQTKGATAVIKRVEIGRVSVENVRALVLKDRSLSGTLLGMSFMNRLSTYQVANGELKLIQ